MGKKVSLIDMTSRILLLAESSSWSCIQSPDCQRRNVDLRMLSMAGGREGDSGDTCSGYGTVVQNICSDDSRQAGTNHSVLPSGFDT